MKNDQKKVYVVLGMPRSGTSAITRSLEVLGICLGDHLIPANVRWNAKGYFEDQDIVRQVNKKVLNTLFDNWESINILEPQQFLQPALEDIRAKAVQLIQDRYENKSQWGFKDPRTVRLLPFWQSIFNELSLDEHYIITLRNPLASAHSFKNLTKIDLEKALLLWLAHLIPAIEETKRKKRIIVSYDLLIQNPVHQLKRLQSYFNIQAVNEKQIKQYSEEFLDRKLTHYQFSDAEFKTHSSTAIIPIGIRLYDLLLKVARDELSLDQNEFTSEWDKIKAEYQVFCPLYSYMDDLLKRNKKYERELRTINKSLPWKMIYPFRVIDTKLRSLRKNLSQKSK